MTSPAIAPHARLITPSSWVYYAQRALTGAWVDRAGLPLESVQLTWDLANDSMTGVISPAIAMAPASDGRPVIDEWSTLIYAVADGVIRWGGIVTSSELAGPSWTVTANGFRGYPAGIPYLGPVWFEVGVDPLDVIRYLWHHVQSYPGGKLGLTVDDTTQSAARLGTAAQRYELDPWNLTDCGAEMTNLLAACPAETTERHAFAGFGETVSHTLAFGVPRIGLCGMTCGSPRTRTCATWCR